MESTTPLNIDHGEQRGHIRLRRTGTQGGPGEKRSREHEETSKESNPDWAKGGINARSRPGECALPQL